MKLKFSAAFALGSAAGRWPAGARRWQRRYLSPVIYSPARGVSLSSFLRGMLSPRSATVLSLTVQNVLCEEVEAALQQLSVGVGERCQLGEARLVVLVEAQ